jgi:signal transduction histidine kinase/CheY-like chemotaxis protein
MGDELQPDGLRPSDLGEPVSTARHGLSWWALPRVAQLYVAAVIASGAYVFTLFFPTAYPEPVLFVALLAAACVTSTWKVTLPISVAGESTLSVSYAAHLMALLLLGPRAAIVIAVAGAWAQCTLNVKGRYPAYCTVFSMAAEAITMAVTGAVYVGLGGPLATFDLAVLPKPLVGAIATYFIINTGLVAGAIALSTRRNVWHVWQADFLWSASSFIVAGTAGALAAVVIARGDHWNALLMLAPIYLTYSTYQLFTGRLEDQKRHEQALAEEKERERAARASAEEANRLKDEFLAMVSHELRTPLTAIVGWSEMLRSNKLASSRRERACQVIHDSARRQAQMIDELLDVSRIVSGKFGVNRAAIDLAGVVYDALEVVQPSAVLKGIHMTMDVDPALGSIHGDGDRLQQIVWNLLSNAVKFSPDGGTIHVRVRRLGHIAELVVTDNGPGIPAEFLPSMFEPFRQGDGSTTRQHGGLGLGLAIVKHLVEAHRGTVTAENRSDGCGAIFTVRLPMLPLAVESRSHAATVAPTTLEGMSVLVVDDDEETRDVIAAHLADHYAHVITAESSSAAMDVLNRERVDVLVTDVAMPGEDGYTLLRKVRASTSAGVAAMPAVALTALAREEDRQRALEAGFQLHLPKPIDIGTLVTAISRVGGTTPAPTAIG